MKKLAILLLAFTLASRAGDCSPEIHIDGNFTYDIDGTPDNRPCNAGYDDPPAGPCFWGTHGAQVSTLRFVPPPIGRSIRILAVHGDVIAWRTARGRGLDNPEAGHATGVLAAVMTLPESEGSVYADLAADDHLIYRQAVIGSNGATQAEFGSEFAKDDPNAVLGFDDALYFKAAKYLDTSDRTTHIETTWQVKFCYEAAR